MNAGDSASVGALILLLSRSATAVATATSTIASACILTYVPTQSCSMAIAFRSKLNKAAACSNTWTAAAQDEAEVAALAAGLYGDFDDSRLTSSVIAVMRKETVQQQMQEQRS